MKIYFVRHGESQANLLGIISNRTLPHHLTPAGREQAALLADSILGRPIRRIYTSPLLRAVETSTILSNRLRIEYEIADGLREYDCGVAEGRADDAAWQLWQAEYDAWLYQHDYDHKIEDGESFSQVRQRFVHFIAGLVARYGGTDAELVCVSHGGIYSVMFPLIMANVDPTMIKRHVFGYTSCIVAEHRPVGFVCIAWDGIPIEVD